MSRESRAFFTAAGRFVSSENRVKMLSALRLEAEEEKRRRRLGRVWVVRIRKEKML
jgi:hypothetical protein